MRQTVDKTLGYNKPGGILRKGLNPWGEQRLLFPGSIGEPPIDADGIACRIVSTLPANERSVMQLQNWDTPDRLG
ncbi:hypothetical protein C7B61_05775 [filamentous cyanobacterium CCP1]|nr:hypothetical protein C7B76_07590 [filamentous cyanobacterium CCP2]PSB67513.1 hypothetical protein C7B61_05775 [filamentous cyanobacterium CCP1]